jgi:hypothetical protein
MATTDEQGLLLSDEEIAKLLDLVAQADSVELKLTIPDSHQRSTVSALDMDALEAEIRQVFFFDTPDLRLSKHGVVVRARRVQGKGDDSVIKLRPVVPSELPKKVRTSPNLGVELDALPGGYVCSASLKRTLKKPRVRSVAAGQQPVHKLFSKEQRAFFEDHAPEGIALDDLTVLGPITLLKLKFSPEGYPRRLVAELWLYPDGTRILELSTKCLPGEAMEVALGAKAFLSGRGVDLTGEQQTKTATALRFFSQELAAAGA